MAIGIFIHLLVAILFPVVFAQKVLSTDDAVEAAFASSPSTLQTKSRTESETDAPLFERSFPRQKSAETIAPRERGFPLPEIKPARELGAPVAEHEPGIPSSSATLPFIAAPAVVDNDATTVATVSTEEVSRHYHQHQNATQQEVVEHREVSDFRAAETPQIDLAVDALTVTGDKTDASTEEPKERITEIEEDTLPPEVTAADPFATTSGENSTTDLMSSASQESTQHGNYSHTNFGVSASLNFEADTAGRSALSTNAASTTGSDSITVRSASTMASSSVEPGYRTVAIGAADGNSLVVPEISTAPVEVQGGTKTAAVSEAKEHIRTTIWTPTSTSIAGTKSDVSERTTASAEHVTEAPLLHPAASHTFRESEDEHSSTIEQSGSVKSLNEDEIAVAVDVTPTAEGHHTISAGSESVPSVELVPSAAVSESISRASSSEDSTAASPEEALGTVPSETEQESGQSSTTAAVVTYEVVSKTADGFATESHFHEHEHEQGDEHEHEDESLFVGDKTLFSQDNTMKALQDFGTTRPDSGFASEPEMEQTTEENFGVPGFSRVEGPGPEATEQSHKPEADVDTSHSSAPTSSSFSRSEVRTGVPADFANEGRGEFREHEDGEHRSVEVTHSATESPFDNGEEPKDISVTDDDDSAHVHTSLEEVAQTFKPTAEEEPKPEPEPIPESTPTTENEQSEAPKGTFVQNMEPKAEPEPTGKPENSEESTDDSGGVLHTHHTHVTDSGDAKEGAYKTPFSFYITSIDYTPEFGDPDSGKYRKLQDQLLPDLEEIFGSIFGRTYEGVHLVRFLKGSVIVDGIVYTSTKPDDMEQLATEFEQQVTAKNSQIGGNDVDPRSIALNGYISKNYIERVHEGYTSGNTSSYIVGGGIAIGILAILLIAFAVIAMNNRRTNGTLKLKEENIAMAENGRSPRQNGRSPVNLMGYGNGRSVQGGLTTNGQPPMVMIGSQMRPVHMHAHAHATQPFP